MSDNPNSRTTLPPIPKISPIGLSPIKHHRDSLNISPAIPKVLITTSLDPVDTQGNNIKRGSLLIKPLKMNTVQAQAQLPTPTISPSNSSTMLQDMYATEPLYVEELSLLQSHIEPNTDLYAAIDRIRILHDETPYTLDGIDAWFAKAASHYARYIALFRYTADDSPQVIYLCKRPLIRLKYLSKALQQDGNRLKNRSTAVLLNTLATQAKLKLESVQTQALNAGGYGNSRFLFTKVKNFDTLEPVSATFDPMAIISRGHFDLTLDHPTGKWPKLAIEAFLLGANNEEQSLALCSLEYPGRALLFPVFRKGDLVFDTATSQPNIMVMNCCACQRQKKIKLERVTADDDEQAAQDLADWRSKLCALFEPLPAAASTPVSPPSSSILNQDVKNNTALRHGAQVEHVTLSPALKPKMVEIEKRDRVSESSPVQKRPKTLDPRVQLQEEQERDEQPYDKHDLFKRQKLYAKQKQEIEEAEKTQAELGLGIMFGPKKSFDLPDVNSFTKELNVFMSSSTPDISLRPPSILMHPPVSPPESPESTIESIDEADLNHEHKQEAVEEEPDRLAVSMPEITLTAPSPDAQPDITAGAPTPIPVTKSTPEVSTSDHISKQPPPIPLPPLLSNKPEAKRAASVKAPRPPPPRRTGTAPPSSHTQPQPQPQRERRQPPLEPEFPPPPPPIPSAGLPKSTPGSAPLPPPSSNSPLFTARKESATPPIVKTEFSKRGIRHHARRISSEFETVPLAGGLNSEELRNPSPAPRMPAHLNFTSPVFFDDSESEAEDEEGEHGEKQKKHGGQFMKKVSGGIKNLTRWRSKSVGKQQRPEVGTGSGFKLIESHRVEQQPGTMEEQYFGNNDKQANVPDHNNAAAPKQASKSTPTVAAAAVTTGILETATQSKQENATVQFEDPVGTAVCVNSHNSTVESGSKPNTQASFRSIPKSASTDSKSSTGSSSGLPASPRTLSTANTSASSSHDQVCIFRAAASVLQWRDMKWILINADVAQIEVVVTGKGGIITCLNEHTNAQAEIYLNPSNEVRNSTIMDVELVQPEQTTMFRMKSMRDARKFMEAIKVAKRDVKQNEPLLQSNMSQSSSNERLLEDANNMRSFSDSSIASNSTTSRSTVMETTNTQQPQPKKAITKSETQSLLLNHLRCKWYVVGSGNRVEGDGIPARFSVYSVPGSTDRRITVKTMDSGSNVIFDHAVSPNCLQRVGHICLSVRVGTQAKTSNMVQFRGDREAQYVSELLMDA